MNSIRRPDAYVTVNTIAQFSFGGSSSTPIFATVNRTPATSVAAGAAVPFTSVGASRYLLSGITLSNGDTFIIPDGVYMIENVSFPGNGNLDFRVKINGVDVSGLVSGGSIYQDRVSATNNGTSTLQIVNASASSVTLSGVDGEAFISFTRSSS